MKGLPVYQSIIRDSIEEFGNILNKYNAADAILPEDLIRNYCDILLETKHHCNEMLERNMPMVMMFGVYNSGKSTLINALLGDNKASVADIPETDRITAYQWNGYELIDTPGIDAPIEHENISYESLTQCHVVIFVISAAYSFENARIYEAMRDVLCKEKRLIIVLNDKEGIGIEEIGGKYHQVIQRNLIQIGISNDKASKFTLMCVDAKLALEGRLALDEELVEQSGIFALENVIVDEIKRVNGFEIVSHLCGYLIDKFKILIEPFAEVAKVGVGNHWDDFKAIRKEYSDFYNLLDNKVNELCLPMDSALMACFPTIEEIENSNAQINSDEVNNKIREVITAYSNSISELINMEVERYQKRLASEFNKIKDVAINAGSITPTNLASLQSMDPQLSNQGYEISAVSTSDNRLCDTVDNIGTILTGTSLAAKALSISIPVIGSISFPLAAVFAIVPKIFRAIFGKSQAEIENERIQAEADARRRAEEERARNIALWREQLTQYCTNTRIQFSNEVRVKFLKDINNEFEKLFSEFESSIISDESKVKQVISDYGNIQRIILRLEKAHRDVSEAIY